MVSEETGIISIVSNGQIKRNFNSISASVELNHLLLSEENVEKDNFVKKVMKLFTKKEKGEDKK